MKQTAVEFLIEQIKIKADNVPTNTKENRMAKGIYVDCLIMAKQAKEMEKQQQGYCDEEVKRLAFKFYLEMSKQMNVPDNLITENYTNVDEWFEQLNPIKKYYEQMDKEVHFNRGNLNK